MEVAEILKAVSPMRTPVSQVGGGFAAGGSDWDDPVNGCVTIAWLVNSVSGANCGNHGTCSGISVATNPANVKASAPTIVGW